MLSTILIYRVKAQQNLCAKFWIIDQSSKLQDCMGQTLAYYKNKQTKLGVIDLFWREIVWGQTLANLRIKRDKLGLSCAKLRLNWASLPVSIFSKYFQLRFKFLINIIIVLRFKKQGWLISSH